MQGSRDYAKRLGDRLKDRVFLTIFPRLAEGFLADRRERLKRKGQPTPEELSDIYEATLTLLYRLLFLLYAESRDLLPVREGPYGEASLKKIKEEVAAKAGIALEEVDAPLDKTYSSKATSLHDRLETLFKAMDKGDPVLNVPTYNGGLFSTTPDATEDRDHRIARFLRDHRVPDSFLAKAIDRLARDQDEKTLGLVFIDFKSLEVRHLGSIYEGLTRVQTQGRGRGSHNRDGKEPREIYPALAGENQARAKHSKLSSRRGKSTSRTTRPSARRPALITRPIRSSNTSSPRRSARSSMKSSTRCGPSSARSAKRSKTNYKRLRLSHRRE